MTGTVRGSESKDVYLVLQQALGSDVYFPPSGYVFLGNSLITLCLIFLILKTIKHHNSAPFPRAALRMTQEKVQHLRLLQGCVPTVPALWEAETGRSKLQTQPGQCRDLV